MRGLVLSKSGMYFESVHGVTSSTWHPLFRDAIECSPVDEGRLRASPSKLERSAERDGCQNHQDSVQYGSEGDEPLYSRDQVARATLACLHDGIFPSKERSRPKAVTPTFPCYRSDTAVNVSATSRGENLYPKCVRGEITNIEGERG
jgi:hypothetical protein